MQLFWGHFIASLYWYVTGLWWYYRTLNRYFNCRSQQTQFISTCTFTAKLTRKFGHVPVESLWKFGICTLGILTQYFTGFKTETYTLDDFHRVSHMIIYLMFASSGVMDILVKKQLAPNGADYAMFGLSIFMQVLLFEVHLANRPPVDVLAHRLVELNNCVMILVLIAEAANRSTVLLPIIRAWLALVQGLWFNVVGCIMEKMLHVDMTKLADDHRIPIIVAIVYSFNIVINFLVIMVAGFVMCLCYKSRTYILFGPSYHRLQSSDIDNTNVANVEMDAFTSSLLPHK